MIICLPGVQISSCPDGQTFNEVQLMSKHFNKNGKYKKRLKGLNDFYKPRSRGNIFNPIQGKYL